MCARLVKQMVGSRRQNRSPNASCGPTFIALDRMTTTIFFFFWLSVDSLRDVKKRVGRHVTLAPHIALHARHSGDGLLVCFFVSGGCCSRLGV